MNRFAGRFNLHTFGLTSSVVLLLIANVPARARTAEEQERGYRLDAMEQALQAKQHFDLYGLHFDTDKTAIQPESKSLLDDIATALKNFPDWHLRIIGHTDSAGDPQHNVHLSLDRAIAIEAALVDRGVDPQRLETAGLGESRPIASNATADGRAGRISGGAGDEAFWCGGCGPAGGPAAERNLWRGRRATERTGGAAQAG